MRNCSIKILSCGQHVILKTRKCKSFQFSLNATQGMASAPLWESLVTSQCLSKVTDSSNPRTLNNRYHKKTLLATGASKCLWDWIHINRSTSVIYFLGGWFSSCKLKMIVEWMTKAMFSTPKLNEKKSVGIYMCLQMSWPISYTPLCQAEMGVCHIPPPWRLRQGVFWA